MREHPGPVFGWPALFAQLAVDLRGDILPDGVVVFEDIHLASADSPTLSLAVGTCSPDWPTPRRACW